MSDQKEIWDFFVLDMHESYISEKVIEMQKQGWIVAGAASTRYAPSPTSSIFISIPLKRLVQWEAQVPKTVTETSEKLVVPDWIEEHNKQFR